MKTVVIPCAGTGSRLGELTKNYNKAMITLGPKPVISYIIEHFKKEDEIIILLGYKGDLLKQVITALYPDWNIKFRTVCPFEGEGSGLGYSLSVAMDLLQKPFIFWPNDTLVDNDFDRLPYDHDWVMLSVEGKDSSAYRHVLLRTTLSGEYATLLPKESTGYTNSFPYVGICYVKDYERFWSMFSKNRELFVNEGEATGLNNIPKLFPVEAENWVDTGNLTQLEKAKEYYSSKMEETILEKPNEAIWFIDDRVIKFHIDPKFISDRVKRFDTLLDENQKKARVKMPKLVSYSENIYVYKREPGTIASKCISLGEFEALLNSFFSYELDNTLTDEDKLAIYKDFYKSKTLDRILEYKEQNQDVDLECYINGLFCFPVYGLVRKINWEKIAKNGVFTKHYHGDFHLENILVQDGNFVLLDWRQNFGKVLNGEYGDVYYDLAKMWHSLIVNHAMVKDKLFSIKEERKGFFTLDIHRTLLDTEMEKILLQFIERNFSVPQAKLLTALIFINIAACHIYPYSKFLFYLGKYFLNKVFVQYPELFVLEEKPRS